MMFVITDTEALFYRRSPICGRRHLILSAVEWASLVVVRLLRETAQFNISHVVFLIIIIDFGLLTAAQKSGGFGGGR